MGEPVSEPPIAGATVGVATAADAAELMVLQRCCWVDEAIANETLEIAALVEPLDVVAGWIESWTTSIVRLDGRLIGSIRARRQGSRRARSQRSAAGSLFRRRALPRRLIG